MFLRICRSRKNGPRRVTAALPNPTPPLDKPQTARYNIKGLCTKRSVLQSVSFSQNEKPSLVGVAVSAFHDNRNSILPDMKRDPHEVTPFRGSVTDRLSTACWMCIARPLLRGRCHFNTDFVKPQGVRPLDKPQTARYNINRAMHQAVGPVKDWVYSTYEKPSLGRVAVSAFHDNRNSILPDMKRDPHEVTPFRGSVTDRLSTACWMCIARPLFRGRRHFNTDFVKPQGGLFKPSLF